MAVVRNSLEKIEEVQEAAEKLNLSKDVRGWNKEDVQKWILWAIREFYSLCLDLLEIDGRDLSRLKLSEFSQCVPDLATYFYNELQIWKQALDPHNTESIFIKTPEEKVEELPTYVSQQSQTPPPSPSPFEDDLDVAEEMTVDTTESSLSFEQEEIISPKSVELIREDTPKHQEPVVIIPESMKTEKQSPTTKLPSTASPAVGRLPFAFPLMGGMVPSPLLSPHVMSHGQRPRLIIPPPGMGAAPFAGFQVPYPVSPALLPQSPFRSPMMSPDIHSPSLLPHMEALKENIMRLEQHRQRQRQKLLEHQNSVESGVVKPVKRRRKRRSTKEADAPNTFIPEGANNEVTTTEAFGKGGKTPEVKNLATTSPNVASPKDTFPRPEERMLTWPGVVPPGMEQAIHPAVAEFLMRQNSNNETLEQLQNNNNTLPKLKRHLSSVISKEDPTRPHSSLEEGTHPRNDKPAGKSPYENKARSVTVVRQNSHEIPYYQATSLEAGSLKEESLGDEEDAEEEVRRTAEYRKFNLSEIQRDVQCSSRVSSARDSYSPISSPSDTEVDLSDRGLHPHSNLLNYSDDLVGGNSPCSSMPYTPNQEPQLALPLIPTVISSSAATPANTVLSLNCVEPAVQKTHKKRGRPPGTKMLSRPLGPNDIHAGVFRANHLWKFLLEMLEQPQQFGASIQWLDRAKGVFKIVNSAHIASLWGKRKNNGKMTYDKFSRSIRQYYKKGIIIKTKPSKLIYQFGAEYFNPNLE